MIRRPAPFDALPAARRPREYRLVREADGLQVRLWFTLSADSGWFAGHFPHRPVLPGVTQVHLAAVVGQSVFGPLNVLGTRRLKFQRPVMPDAALELELSADALAGAQGGGPNRVRFTLRAEAQTAASGTLVTGPVTGLVTSPVVGSVASLAAAK